MLGESDNQAVILENEALVAEYEEASSEGIDRTSTASAQSVIEALFPDRTVRGACLAQLEASIRAANSVNSASWSLTLFPREVRLNVAYIETLVFLPNALYLVIDLDALPPEEQATYPEVSTGEVTGRRYPAIPTACGLLIPDSGIPGQLRPALEPHIHLVRRAAAVTKTRCHRYHTHSPGVISYLSQQLRRESPNPSYYPSDRPSSDVPDDVPEPLTEQRGHRDSVSSALVAAGLSYTPWQIATFYTVLQAKGFVILSGISGTGKSKLAQAFASFLTISPPAEDASFDEEADRLDLEAPWVSAEISDSGAPVRITARKYMLQHKFFVVPKAAYSFFNPPFAGTKGEIDFFYGDMHQRCRIRHRFVKGGPQTLLELIFQGPLRAWFASHVSLGDEFAVAPERVGARQIGVRLFTKDTEPAPLVAPMGQQPTLSVEQDSALSGDDVDNALFLPVRPDWRDSKSILGYHNPLTDRYEWTPFLRFLLRAKASYEANDGRAWLLILDEMNLAHVEHYFADLLSVLESGRDGAG